jgi:hypothetical protein
MGQVRGKGPWARGLSAWAGHRKTRGQGRIGLAGLQVGDQRHRRSISDRVPRPPAAAGGMVRGERRLRDLGHAAQDLDTPGSRSTNGGARRGGRIARRLDLSETTQWRASRSWLSRVGDRKRRSCDAPQMVGINVRLSRGNKESGRTCSWLTRPRTTNGGREASGAGEASTPTSMRSATTNGWGWTSR